MIIGLTGHIIWLVQCLDTLKDLHTGPCCTSCHRCALAPSSLLWTERVRGAAVCVCVWECVKGLEHHQTIKLPYSGQDNALLFVFFCCILLRGFFLPLLVLRGVSVLYRQTPTLSCSLPSSQTGLSIERE